MEGDGCTGFVNTWRGVDLKVCCDVHDYDFYHGETFFEFVVANIKLASCFANIGVFELAMPAFIATSTIGIGFYLWGPKALREKARLAVQHFVDLTTRGSIMTEFTTFKGAAKRLEDLDIPRIAHRIKVGEDEMHALMDTETNGEGFDSQGRPKMLFEPHRFYANLSGDERAAAVAQGLAYKSWKPGAYPRDSYPRLKKAMLINQTAALKSASWGLGQVMGENHKMAGYTTVQAMVLATMEDEENHLDAMVNFCIKAGIDDELRKLAALKRPTTPADCIPIVEVYNGKGFRKNDYHTKFAANHNKWRGIKDTPWTPPAAISPPVVEKDVEPAFEVIASVQQLLRDKGYPEVGEPDNLFGTRTRNAILAFQADNKLTLTGVVTDELLAALIKATPRANSAARETATAKDLKGNQIVDAGSLLQKLGVGVLAATGLGGLSEGTATIDQIRKGITDVRALGESLGDMGPWLLGLGVGAAVIYFGSKIVQRQVEAYREGRSV